jgi:hypothetical protein
MEHSSTMSCKADVAIYVELYGNPTNLPITNTTYPTIRDAIRFEYGYWMPVELGEDPDQLMNLSSRVNNRMLVKAQHAVHTKRDAPDVIAYFRDERSRRADRVTTARPGKYLAGNYNTVFNDVQIRNFADTMRLSGADPIEHLQFAETADDIATIYTAKGSMNEGSCMRHEADQWSLRVDGELIHPSAVYDGPDSRVAYIKIGNRYKARTVVLDKGRFENNKRIIRVYGDISMMEKALKSLGYSYGDFDGARLAKLKLENGDFAAPYWDSDCNRCNIGEDFLEMSHNGEYGDVDYQECYLRYARSKTCECCDSTFPEGDITYDFYDNPICTSCADYNYRHTFCNTSNYTSLLHEDDAIINESDSEYYQDCSMTLDHHGIVRSDNGAYYFKSDCHRVIYASTEDGVPTCHYYTDDIGDLISVGYNRGIEYFVHNDIAPEKVQQWYNQFFNNDNQLCTTTAPNGEITNILILEAA